MDSQKTFRQKGWSLKLCSVINNGRPKDTEPGKEKENNKTKSGGGSWIRALFGYLNDNIGSLSYLESKLWLRKQFLTLKAHP